MDLVVGMLWVLTATIVLLGAPPLVFFVFRLLLEKFIDRYFNETRPVEYYTERDN
jgi:hypothetical protein